MFKLKQPRDKRLTLALTLMALNKTLRTLTVTIYDKAENADGLAVVLKDANGKACFELKADDIDFDTRIREAAGLFDKIDINVIKSDRAIAAILQALKTPFLQKTHIELNGQIDDADAQELLTALPSMPSPENLSFFLNCFILDKSLLQRLVQFNKEPYKAALLEESHRNREAGNEAQGLGKLCQPLLDIVCGYLANTEYTRKSKPTLLESQGFYSKKPPCLVKFQHDEITHQPDP